MGWKCISSLTYYSEDISSKGSWKLDSFYLWRRSKRVLSVLGCGSGSQPVCVWLSRASELSHLEQEGGTENQGAGRFSGRGWSAPGCSTGAQPC